MRAFNAWMYERLRLGARRRVAVRRTSATQALARRLSFEALEDRRLLTVTASTAGNVIEVNLGAISDTANISAVSAAAGGVQTISVSGTGLSATQFSGASIVIGYGAASQSVTFNGSTAFALGGYVEAYDGSNATGETLTFANTTTYSFSAVQLFSSTTASVGTVAVNNSLSATNGTFIIGSGTVADSPVVTFGGTGTISAAGGDLDIGANTTLAIATPLSDPTGTVRLVSGSGISETSTISSQNLSATAASGNIVLEQSNAVNGTIAFSTTAATYSANNGVAFNDTDAATVGATTSSGTFAGVAGVTATDGDANLSGDGLTIDSPISASSGVVRLVESGAISQSSSGTITAASLGISDTGGNEMLEASNAASTLATTNSASGSGLTFNDGTTAATVGSVAAASSTLDPGSLFSSAITGIGTNNADVNLASGGLLFSQAIYAGTGTVRLVESGNVSETNTGEIVAGALSMSDSGGSVVLELNDEIGTFAAADSASAGAVTFNNVITAITVGTVASAGDPAGIFGAVTGITTSNGDVNFDGGAGGLAIDNPIAAGAGTVRLVAAGAMTQLAAGTITASNLDISIAGANAVLESANDVGTFASDATSSPSALTFSNGANALTIGRVTSESSTLDPSGLFNATITGIQAGGTATEDSGDIDLNSGALTIDDNVRAGILSDVRIIASGAVTEGSSGSINGTLSVTTSSGNVVLENSNVLNDTIAVDDTAAGGSVTWNDTFAGTVSSVAAASAALDPNGLFGTVTGITTFNGDVNLDTSGLAINYAISVGTGNVRLVESGAVTETAGITAAGLSISNTSVNGKLILESTNAVSTLAVSDTGSIEPVTFNDGTTALTIGSIPAAPSGVDSKGLFNAVTGLTTTNGDVNLLSAGLSINSAVTAGTGNVRLVESATVTLGMITAAGLSVSDSNGSVTLGSTTVVGTLAASDSSSGGSFTFDAGNTLTIGSIAIPGGVIDPSGLFVAISGITTQGGAISVVSAGANTALTANDNVVSNGGSVTLQATGNVTIEFGAMVNSETAPLTLAADVTASGAGDDGVGTLTIASGVTVASAGTITLRGAAESIDTGITPAVVGEATSSQATTPSTTLTGLSGPEWMAFDPSGNLYVGNYNGGNGTTVSVFAPGSTTPTSTLTGLDGPTAIAVDSSGNIYVANATANSVSVFAPGSTTPSATLIGLNSPTALAFYGGSLYVANSNLVSVFAPGNITPSRTLTGVSGAFRLAFDSHGDLFVTGNTTNSTTVSEFAPGSTIPTSILVGVDAPRGLAFDSSGNLYVSNNNNGSGTTVSVFAPGSVSPTSTLTGLSGPSSLAFDSSGNLYVSNDTANTVSEFAPGSTTPTFIFTGLSDPDHLIFGPSGILYASNLHGNTVSEFSPPSVTAAAAAVVIQSSVETRPMLIGGTNSNPVAGINLTSAELAQIYTTSTGTITFGDGQQTGNITFSTATPATTAGANLVVVQGAAGAGRVILDDGAGSGTALNGNGGSISITAGTGGITALAASDSTAEISTTGPAVTLLTAGPIGTSSNRIQFADDSNSAQQVVSIGSTTVQPSSVYLDGLGSLTLNNVFANGSSPTVDVTARTNLVVASGGAIDAGNGPILLGADLTPAEMGDDGVGTLAINAGATVTTTGTITLRGADVNIDTSSNPAVIGAQRSLGITPASIYSAGISSYPFTLAFDSGGNLYVAYAGNNTVEKFAPGSTTASATYSADLDDPHALAFDTSGNLYVANYDNSTVEKFAPGSSTAVATYSAGVSRPYALAIDSSGNLYVANSANSTVEMFAPGSTTPSATYSTNVNDPLALAFDSSGNLYVANSGSYTVAEFAPGSTTAIATYSAGVDDPHALAFDSNGNLYVANYGNSTVEKFAPGSTTAIATYTSSAGVNEPLALAIDSSGNLYVANYVGNTVEEFAPGRTIAGATYSVGVGDPLALAIDSSGNLYVANNFPSSTVEKFSPTSTTPTAAGVVIQSSVESQPMLIGGTNSDPVAGINLTSAELGQIFTTSTGTITIGDSNQTGNITFATATPATTAGAALDVVQSIAGAGQIILDEGGSGGTALNGNGGAVTLSAGTGGVEANVFTAGLPLATAGFTAAGTLNLTLGFAPTAGMQLTIVDNTAAAGNGIDGAFSNLPQGGTYTASYLGTAYTFQANYDGGDGNDLVLTEIQSSGPAVIGAFVSGTAWSTTYLNLLDSASLGSSAAADQGFEFASGANQLTTMPWTNINQISIAFGEPVSVSQSSLTLYNSANTAIAISGFSYNSTANIATWQFATPLVAGKYVMNLAANSVTDSNGQELDGAWTTSVSTFAAGSGDGTPGGDFNFYFDVLPGDVNSSGSVTNGDVLLTKLQVGAVSDSSNYQDDVNASGNITNGDVLLEKLQVGNNINSFPAPQLPPQSAPDAAPAISLLDPATPATAQTAAPDDSQADISAVVTAPAAAVVFPMLVADDADVTPDDVTDSSDSGGATSAATQAPAISLASSVETTSAPATQPTSAGPVSSAPISPTSSTLIVPAPATVLMPASPVATMTVEPAPSALPTDPSPAALPAAPPVAQLQSLFRSTASTASTALTDDALALVLDSLGLASSGTVFTPADDVADNAAPTSLPAAIAAGSASPASALVWDEVFSAHSDGPAEEFAAPGFDLAARLAQIDLKSVNRRQA